MARSLGDENLAMVIKYLLAGMALRIHPGRLAWNIIIEVRKISFPSKWVTCRFHVNLPGCISLQFAFKIHR